jgi:hypothetical protein
MTASLDARYRRRGAILVAQLLGAAVITIASPLGAQNAAAIRTRPLGAVELEHGTPFTNVTGVRELSDGRLVVGDALERKVQLIDPRNGSVLAIARQGRGPNEFGFVGKVLPAPGDTTWLVDGLASRILVIAPSGEVTGMLPFSAPSTPRSRELVPSAVDRQGRMYAQTSALPGPRGGVLAASDSLGVVRIGRDFRGDTVGWVHRPRLVIQRAESGPPRMTGFGPFSLVDAWAAGADGSIAIVRANPYRVEWIGPTGARTSGPTIPYTRHPVTDTDKQLMYEADRGRRTGPYDMATFLAANGQWDAFKPPFQGQPHIAPDGRVWIPVMPRVWGDSITYDVVDGRGQLVERVAFPKNVKLVGFSGRSIYTTRTDADDLLYLQRRKP